MTFLSIIYKNFHQNLTNVYFIKVCDSFAELEGEFGTPFLNKKLIIYVPIFFIHLKSLFLHQQLSFGLEGQEGQKG